MISSSPAILGLRFSRFRKRHRPTTKILVVFLLSLALTLPVPSSAITVGGITFPDQVVMNGKTLKLVGMGSRTWLFFQVYVAALYMEEPLDDGEAVINTEQTKYVLIQLDSRIVTFRGFKYTINRGLQKNLTKDQLQKLESKVNRFYDICRKQKYKLGDRIGLVYEKKDSLTIVYNAEVLGQIEGSDFTKALYRIWLGEYPDSAELKNSLLGRDRR